MSSRRIAALTLAAASVLACDNEPFNVASRTASSALASSSIAARTQSGTELPFHGSYMLETNSIFTPPTTLTINGTATGHASHLGRFTATFVDVVNTTTATSTGTFNLTAANRDQLFATTNGAEVQFIPPNVSHIALVATIVGGTGRFAAASGTFAIHSVSVIDFAKATSSGSASFEGHIKLNK